MQLCHCLTQRTPQAHTLVHYFLTSDQRLHDHPGSQRCWAGLGISKQVRKRAKNCGTSRAGAFVGVHSALL
jgi:hypothetical protein